MPHHIVPTGTVTKPRVTEEQVTIDKITLVKFYVTDIGDSQYVCDYTLAYKDINGDVIDTVNGILSMADLSVELLIGIHNLENLVLTDIQSNGGAEAGTIIGV